MKDLQHSPPPNEKSGCFAFVRWEDGYTGKIFSSSDIFTRDESPVRLQDLTSGDPVVAKCSTTGCTIGGSHTSTPSPYGLNTSGPSPGGSHTVSPSPYGLNTFGPSPGGSHRVSPSPYGLNASGPSPGGSHTVSPSPYGLNTSGPSPGGSHTSTPSPYGLNTSGPSPGGSHTSTSSPYGLNTPFPSPDGNHTSSSSSYGLNTSGPSPGGSHTSSSSSYGPAAFAVNPPGKEARLTPYRRDELVPESAWTPCDGCKWEVERILCEKRKVDEVISRIDPGQVRELQALCELIGDRHHNSPDSLSGQQELFPGSGIFISSFRLAAMNHASKPHCMRLFHALFDHFFTVEECQNAVPFGRPGNSSSGKEGKQVLDRQEVDGILILVRFSQSALSSFRLSLQERSQIDVEFLKCVNICSTEH
ncbi:hypothetical protein WMY93_033331 [Mugilogobius chulae]|uniref:Uncharacterized protein n=1 Tax=Mugilogobius chulae TaxID=88201 RepID=A0AAW0MLH0_9GOBI